MSPPVPPTRTYDRRAADRRRTESFRLNRTLLDNMPCPAMLIRPGSREVVLTNRAGEQSGAMAGLRCHEGLRQRREPCSWCLAPEAWETGEPQRTTREIDGRTLDIRWVPIDDELYLHSLIDITEHRRLEESLRESERRFRGTFECAQAGIVHVSPDGHYREANDRFCEITGYGRDELRSMTHRHMTHADDIAGDIATYRKLLAGEVNFQASEKRYIRKDGATIWVHRIFGVVRKDDGTPDHFVVVVEDITERKRVEEALTASRDQLRMLSTHIREAVEVERKRIAREIHDVLGQGLLGLRMDTNWVAEQIGDGAPVLRERMADMLDAIDATIATVKRVSTELRPIMLDDLGLGAAIEWQAGEFQRRRAIACRPTVRPRNIEIDHACSTALFRVCQEMLANVARHAGARRVAVRLVETTRAIVLSVRDDGAGIAPGRAEDPMSLGLIGMRERVREFGGTFEIRALPRGGTLARVRIPVGRARSVR
jgi:two-component system sensor histidine kinase UhpB